VFQNIVKFAYTIKARLKTVKMYDKNLTEIECKDVVYCRHAAGGEKCCVVEKTDWGARTMGAGQ